jgi:uncharacterized cysteine cluster protein YcgN (CxxCxxCC family)
MSDGPTERFWEGRALSELTREQWERLCDGCGRCCLVKLEDDDTGEVEYTSVACRHLDLESCRCRRYGVRWELAEDCMILTPDTLVELDWLPTTCAYRLLAANQPLPSWHPLLTGDPGSVHRAGISLRGRAISEDYVHEDDLDDFVSHALR